MSSLLNASKTELSEEITRDLTKNYELTVHKLGNLEGQPSSSNDIGHRSSLKGQIDSLREFFLVQNEMEQDPHAFGTVEIGCRVKSLTSIKRNLVNGIKAQKDNKKVLEALRTSQDPEVWCKQLRDFIGIRVIVRSQRHKHQIYRAIRYLCELNHTERRSSLDIPFVVNEDGKNWKYFNPVIRAYYRPVSVQEFYEAIKETSRIDALSPREREQLLDKLNMSSRHDLNFEFKNTGYSTLQRNLYFQLEENSVKGPKYLFEIQIRTVLEHAWAELEHKMVYKGGPLSEHIKGLFRNYGLNLSSADDTLQMIVDDWRRETDYHVDYTDRSLRIFEHLDKYDRNQHSKVVNHNLARLYSSLSHGYVNDAISIAQSLVKQQESHSIRQAQFKVEEAVCRMCNFPFDQSDKQIDSLLNESIKIGKSKKNLEVQFFANFRMAQHRYFKSESHFVDHIRKNSRTSNHELLIKSRREIDDCTSIIKEAINIYQDITSPEEDSLKWLNAARLEIQILHARCYERYANISNEMTGYFKSRGAILRESPDTTTITSIQENLNKALDIIDAWNILLLKPHLDIQIYNNMDIERYNTKLWCLRLLHKYHVIESNMISNNSQLKTMSKTKEIENKAKKTYNDLLNKRINSENNSKEYPGGEARERLKILIKKFMTSYPTDKDIAPFLNQCSMFELKVLDTIIGLRLVFEHSSSSPSPEQNQLASDFSDLLRKRLVRIASKGDFSFNSYFAYSLFTLHRLY